MLNRFSELARAEIGENKNVVISKNIDGTVFIAQQLLFSEGEQVKGVFLKNAINVDMKGLEALESAIKEAINKMN